MKYAIVINTNDAETVWNALRFGSAALARDHRVSIFLLGPAVEMDSIGDERFNVKKLLQRYEELGGEALSCGTCLRIRSMDASSVCPTSSMDELVRLTEEADRTVVFG
ncbi:MAG: DsrE family protein [Thaumarchaeota archaeon]|nr:DsrE family protein [Nitrososphaerota archaeon]